MPDHIPEQSAKQRTSSRVGCGRRSERAGTQGDRPSWREEGSQYLPFKHRSERRWGDITSVMTGGCSGLRHAGLAARAGRLAATSSRFRRFLLRLARFVASLPRVILVDLVGVSPCLEQTSFVWIIQTSGGIAGSAKLSSFKPRGGLWTSQASRSHRCLNEVACCEAEDPVRLAFRSKRLAAVARADRSARRVQTLTFQIHDVIPRRHVKRVLMMRRAKQRPRPCLSGLLRP